jgi:hypothetical protein
MQAASEDHMQVRRIFSHSPKRLFLFGKSVGIVFGASHGLLPSRLRSSAAQISVSVDCLFISSQNGIIHVQALHLRCLA